MTLRTTFTGRVPELDGLRGVAIALVLIVHLSGLLNGAPGTFSAYVVRSCMLAWSGVDLFFVLSGFLIGGILLDAKSSDHYFRTFYIRRAFRILPLYTVLNLAPLLLVFASPHLRDTAYFVLGRPLPWYVTAFFGQNLVIAFTGVWGNAYLAATWSLAVEEQFYLTLPFVVRKVSTRTLTTLSVAHDCCCPVHTDAGRQIRQPACSLYGGALRRADVWRTGRHCRAASRIRRCIWQAHPRTTDFCCLTARDCIDDIYQAGVESRKFSHEHSRVLGDRCLLLLPFAVGGRAPG